MKVKYRQTQPGFVPGPGGVKPAAWLRSISSRAEQSAGENGVEEE